MRKSAADIWRYTLFGTVAVYSFSVLIFAIAKCSQGCLFFTFLLFPAALSAWYAPMVTLFVFAGSVPLLSGLSLTASALPPGVINSIFSTVYLSWFLRHVLIKKVDIKPITQAGFFIDVLSTVILLSLFSVLILYPFDYWPFLIRSFGNISQTHELYGIYASCFFLHGLFLFPASRDKRIRERKAGPVFPPGIYLSGLYNQRLFRDIRPFLEKPAGCMPVLSRTADSIGPWKIFIPMEVF